MNCAPPPPPVPPPPPPVAAPALAPLPDAAEPYVRRQPTQPMGATLLAPLHTLEPRYEAMVCDLLAQRWPKSDEARLASLRESCDAFPTHLVLVDVARACAAGVASLSRTVEDAQALLVENVLVDELWRGTGLGRTLMEAVHEYARARGFTRMFLSTRDKQAFYARVGYVVSTRAVTPLTAASARLGNEATSRLQAAFGGAGAAATSAAFTWMVKEPL